MLSLAIRLAFRLRVVWLLISCLLFAAFVYFGFAGCLLGLWLCFLVGLRFCGLFVRLVCADLGFVLMVCFALFVFWVVLLVLVLFTCYFGCLGCCFDLRLLCCFLYVCIVVVVFLFCFEVFVLRAWFGLLRCVC